MLPTGDVQGGLRKLETLLRSIKYKGPVDYKSLSNGDPAAFLPIVSYTFTSFSSVIAEQLLEAGLEMTGKTDLRFTETVYKALKNIFQYKPILTKEQFLQWGFSQRKISVVCDIINLVLQRHNQHKKVKPKARFPASHKKVKVETISFANLETAVSVKPHVVNHLQNPPVFHKEDHKETASSVKTATHSAHVERFSSYSPEHGVIELRQEEEETADHHCCLEMEERLSALETRIESLVSGLDQMSILEKRLEKLESLKTIEKSEGQLITVSRETWENLLSRVLLLETKLELSSAKEIDPLPCPPSPTSFVPKSLQASVKCPASRENERKVPTFTEPDNPNDLKERLDRIKNLMKHTASLLKSTDDPTSASTEIL